MKKINTLEEYQAEYHISVATPELFWAAKANSFYWYKKWDSVLNWNFKEPNVSWFEGGKLNITENCLDRHLKKKGDTTAITWVPNDPKEISRCLSYKDLHKEVCKFSNVLRANGAKKGGSRFAVPGFLFLNYYFFQKSSCLPTTSAKQ